MLVFSTHHAQRRRLLAVQRLIAAIPASVIAFVGFDLITGVTHTPLLILSRVLFLLAFVPAAYMWPRLSHTARARMAIVLGVVISVAMFLMLLGTGRSSSPAFGIFWAVPMAVGLIFVDQPKSALACGLTVTLLGAPMLVADGSTAAEVAYFVCVSMTTTAIATFADVLHHRLSQESLAATLESNATLVHFLRSLPVAVYVTDASGAPLYANDEAQHLLGVGANGHGLTGNGYRLVLAESGEPYPVERSPLVTALRGLSSFAGDIAIARAGRRLPVEVFAAPVRGEDGTVKFAVCTMTDMSHRVQTERALQLAQQRDAAIFRATNDVLWEWDLETGEMMLSDRVSEIVGSPQQTMQRSEWIDRVHPEDRTDVVQTLAGVLVAAGESWQGEYRVQRSDGSYAYVMDRAAIVRDNNGRVVQVIGALRDISERQQLEARLALADRMAGIGTLAAGVAHEINNPLAFVLTNIEHTAAVLRSGGQLSREETLLAIDEARIGVDRIRAIVKDLKVFSRTSDDPLGPVDVKQALESAITFAGNEIRHRAKLIRQIENVPNVLGTHAKLGQVLLNLLVNAAQAIGDDRHQQHEISVRTYAQDAQHVVVEVSDTGCGMPEDVEKRIFEPFFTTKPQGVGTGLGLSICHGIIKSFGGEISCATTPGVGTTFRLVLRVADAMNVAVAPAVTSSGTRRRVVAVDDEPFVLAAIGRMFRRDHDVVSFVDARAALAWIEEGNDFDVLLCDLMMPHMSGQALFETICRRFPHLQNRVVFLTGGAFTKSASAFYEGLKNPTLLKPFDRASLLSVIENVARMPKAA